MTLRAPNASCSHKSLSAQVEKKKKLVENIV